MPGYGKCSIYVFLRKNKCHLILAAFLVKIMTLYYYSMTDICGTSKTESSVYGRESSRVLSLKVTVK